MPAFLDRVFVLPIKYSNYQLHELGTCFRDKRDECRQGVSLLARAVRRILGGSTVVRHRPDRPAQIHFWRDHRPLHPLLPLLPQLPRLLC